MRSSAPILKVVNREGPVIWIGHWQYGSPLGR
jgi:hypothetical protein